MRPECRNLHRKKKLGNIHIKTRDTEYMYQRIVTHADFDGIVSAALASHALGVNFLLFTQPRLVAEARVSITKTDVVCDLPYPLECGMWFDHHEGNLDDLKYRKLDIQNIAGKFEAKDSCARVVYEYFTEKNHAFPIHIAAIIDEADIIDAFNYRDIEDWRQETSGKIIDATIKLKEESAEIKWEYLRQMVRHLQKHTLAEVAQMASVKRRYRLYCDEEEKMIEQIKGEISFLPEDTEQKVMVLDLTRHNRRPNLIKHLAYLIHPEAQAVVQVANLFQNQVKTNDLAFSMSLSLNMNRMEHHKDIGDIMRSLNIGGGHPGAAAGTQSCSTKDEMLKTKERMLKEIYSMFIAQ
jgi:oligoribonuclease NrnB/cAMP/cGMP phosphodiesterase (DHH superfamily)